MGYLLLLDVDGGSDPFLLPLSLSLKPNTPLEGRGVFSESLSKRF
jgi:hypothetical protein